MLTFVCMSTKHYLKAWEMRGKIPGDSRGCGEDVGKKKIREVTQELPPVAESGISAMLEASEGNSPFALKPVGFLFPYRNSPAHRFKLFFPPAFFP